MTSSRSCLLMPALFIASLMTRAPRSRVLKPESCPRKLPMGVLTALQITTSFMTLLHFLTFKFGVVVKSSARFMTQMPGSYHITQKRTGCIFVPPAPFVQVFHDMKKGIQPDEITQGQRAHRPIKTGFVGQIDIFFGRHSFIETIDHFIYQRDHGSV